MELCRECHTENLSHSYMCKYVIGGASVGSIFQKYGRFGVKPTSDAFILPAWRKKTKNKETDIYVWVSLEDFEKRKVWS